MNIGKECLVSFIMPAYNVENYIAKSIESVLHQTFDSWELIIVNDGSPDKSREVALSYIAKDPRIVLFDKQNGGLSDARNFGLERAKGDYIVFLDSDDWIEPDAIAHLLPEVIEQDIDVVIFSFVKDWYSKTSSQVYKNQFYCAQDRMLSYNNSIEISKIEQDFLFYAWNKIYNKNFLLSNNLSFEKGLRLIEDCDFNTRALPLARNIRFSSFVLNHYAIRNDLTLSKMFNADILDLKLRFNESTLGMYRQFGFCDIMLDDLKVNLTLKSIQYIMYAITYYAENESFLFRCNYVRKMLDALRPSLLSYHNSNLSMRGYLILRLVRLNSPVLILLVYKLISYFRFFKL